MLDEICAAYDAGHRYKGLSWDETRITATHYRRLQENNRELCEFIKKVSEYNGDSNKLYICQQIIKELGNEARALIAENGGNK